MRAGHETQARKLARDVPLVCGILSSLLYVGTDIAAALRWEGYSYPDQTVSELSAIAAPTRPFVVALDTLYDALLIAFGIGVWLSAGRRRSLRVTAILLVALGVVGNAGLWLFPMHLRGAVPSWTDTMHIVYSSAMVLLILLFIGFGAVAGGWGFRLYSIVTIVALAVFGALTGLQGPRLAANLPTPWMGVLERVNVYGSMLWVLVLAVMLLRGQKHKR